MLKSLKGKHVPYIILTLIGFILNAFMSNMSPFRDCLFCPDVNCFFMEGKAWALGYIPYIDFIDSKGPLLFFIFAIGYLISPESTIGIYLLASVSTIVTLIFAYKTAFYFTKSNNIAMLVAICCSAALFFKPYYGYGPRTEQFIIPFVTWIIYILTTKTENLDKDIKSWTYFGICFGICASVFFLTKYIYAVFPLTAYICTIIFHKNPAFIKKKILYISGAFFLSFFIICLPFLTYIISTKSFDAFVWAYFKLSTQCSTLDSHFEITTKFLSYLNLLINHTLKEPIFYGAIVSLAVFFLPFYKERMAIRNRLTCIFSFLSLILCCSMGLYKYYLVVYFPLFVFPTIFILNKLSINKKTSILLSILILFTNISTYMLSTEIKKHKRISNAPAEWSRDYNHVENIIKSKFRAKIMYLDQLGQGFGIRTGAVPACRSWFSITLEGQELKTIRETAIKNKVPDFIFTFCNTPYKHLLQTSGYNHTITILEGSNMRNGIMLWSKNN